MGIYNDEYFENLLNDYFSNNDELDYQNIASFLLKNLYNSIQTKELDGNLYISEDSEEIIDQLIDLCEKKSEELEPFIEEEKQEQNLSFYQNELLKFQKTINVLKAMKKDILSYRNELADPFSFIALPIDDKSLNGKGRCSLDSSLFKDNTDIESSLKNLESMEKLIREHMKPNGWIETAKTGTGLHNVNGHLMYKNITNNQRILFQQCKNNPKIICVLIIHCRVHNDKDDEKTRYNTYMELEQELSEYLDANFKKDGKVIFDKVSLNALKKIYKEYKNSLALRLGIETDQERVFECLLERLSLYAKEEEHLEMDANKNELNHMFEEKDDLEKDAEKRIK